MDFLPGVGSGSYGIAQSIFFLDGVIGPLYPVLVSFAVVYSSFFAWLFRFLCCLFLVVLGV